MKYCTILIILLFLYTTILPQLSSAEKSSTFSNLGIQTLKLPDFPAQGGVIDTLRTGFFQERNPNQSFWTKEYPVYADFFSTGKIEKISVIKGHPELIFKTWLQKNPSPLIVILPGIGGHYTSDTLTALAELCFEHGFSVLVLSSAMNWQFMESAAAESAPGYPLSDAKDVYNAIKIIVQKLIKVHGEKFFTRKILAGYSLGALHTILIASLEDKTSDNIGFERFIAVNPPVNLYYAARKLDEFYYVWRKYWQKNEIKQKVNQVVKAYWGMVKNKIPPTVKLPITQHQAEFLIGYFFRKKIVGIIYSLHKRKLDCGIIKAESSWFSKRELYKEINRISFAKYISDILTVYYYKKNIKKNKNISKKQFEKELMKYANLRNIQIPEEQKQKIYIIHTIDDFILSDDDKKWLYNNFPNVTFFNHGGHLGELYSKTVQQQILSSINSAEEKK